MAEADEIKILLVETDAAAAADLGVFLTGRGYAVKTAPTCQAALAETRDWKPDLLILNVLIREFSPLDLLADLKKNPFTENQKIIVVSRTPKNESVSGPATAVSGYLTKPVDFEALKEALLRAAGRPSPEKPLTALVADDDTEFSDLLKMFLEANNYRVVAVSDPLKILGALRAEKPDVLLMDLIMPGLDGFSVLEQMRGEAGAAAVPVIILSALRLENYQERGVLTGLPEIVAKEIPRDLLLKLIEEQTARFPAPAPGAETPLAARPRVLLADDQPELLMLMQEVIQDSGFDVTIAADGAEALTAVFDTHPDIIVLDYNMPRKDGLEVAQDLKNNPLFAHIPIIICTAHSEKQTKLKGLSMGIDDYLIKPVDTDELVARIRMILKRNKQVLDTNPLSKLPGNPSIQARVEREIQREARFAVLYLDLNNFKAYNDTYGFEAGDRIIKATANLLVKLTIQNENSQDFIGHIGGDDFIVITDFDKCEDLSRRIVGTFDEIAPSFYSKADRERGHIISTDRQGNIKKFPFLSISIGVVNNAMRPLTSFAQVSNIGTELKKAAKAAGKSHYVIDRRHD